MDFIALKAEMLRRAGEAGFADARVAPARVADDHARRLGDWLAAGMHGEMAYMQRWGGRRADAETVLPGARAVIVLRADYHSGQPSADPVAGPPTVRVAKYALGEDYHIVLKRRAAPLLQWLSSELPGNEWRVATDSAPLLERAFAEAAGVGFTGKNTLLIAPGAGSFFLLAEILTTAPIAPDSPVEGTCGNCTRCIDACPTGAIVAPSVLDARRCISHLNIEKRTDLSPEEERMLHGWAFGCDVCQDVCPYNRAPAVSPIDELAKGGVVAHHEPLATFLAPRTNGEFEKRFAGSPLLRPGRKRLARNAKLAAEQG
jgi:epoxyqueuosine reductase